VESPVILINPPSLLPTRRYPEPEALSCPLFCTNILPSTSSFSSGDDVPIPMLPESSYIDEEVIVLLSSYLVI
jgi:hypothetical protein